MKRNHEPVVATPPSPKSERDALVASFNYFPAAMTPPTPSATKASQLPKISVETKP